MLGFLFKILIKIGLNAGAIYLAINYVPGVTFIGGLKEYLFFGFIAMIANWLIKPILKFLTKPLIWLTFGLFSVIINMIILYGLDYYFPNLKIEGLIALFWSSLIFAIANIY